MSENSDTFLMFNESENNADMYYVTRFLAVDSFIYFYDYTKKKEKLIVSDMELSRAKKESRVENVIPTSKYGLMEKMRKFKDPDIAYCEMIIEFLVSENINSIKVPYNFSVYIADGIRNKGIDIIPTKSPFTIRRQIKNDEEISSIEKAQRAGEYALSEAIKLIKNSKIKNGALLKDDNNYLLTEDLRSMIDISLLSQGCSCPSTIVACGRGSSDPHWEGEGELLANEPIVIDMTPRSKKERYYSDMTRTIIRGIAQDEIKDMYSAVLESQIAGINKIKEGVSGSDIHNIVCDVLEDKGYETSRGKTGEFTEGFIHSTGHSVGLDIHEEPTLSESGKELKAGCVVTVEPGLYYKKFGGVRIEDTVVVTRSGCKNLNNFHKNLVIQ